MQAPPKKFTLQSQHRLYKGTPAALSMQSLVQVSENLKGTWAAVGRAILATFGDERYEFLLVVSFKYGANMAKVGIP